jgi:hypothetical protein
MSNNRNLTRRILVRATVEFEDDVSGQFGNDPYLYKNRALDRFHFNFQIERDNDPIPEREKEFKKLMDRFGSRE